jgi:hypothetical protein
MIGSAPGPGLPPPDREPLLRLHELLASLLDRLAEVGRVLDAPLLRAEFGGDHYGPTDAGLQADSRVEMVRASISM